MVSEARESGWNVETWYENSTSTSHKKPSLPYLSLLAKHNTPYELDRVSNDLPSNLKVPSLKDLSSKALDLLSSSRENKKGLLLMIEGSQIDLCAHENDPVCHVNEILSYQAAIKTVQEWVKEKNSKGEKKCHNLNKRSRNWRYHPWKTNE